MEQESFVLEHRGRKHQVTVEIRHKGRVMRVHHPDGENSVLTGLSSFEDSRDAARSVIEANPSLRNGEAGEDANGSQMYREEEKERI